MIVRNLMERLVKINKSRLTGLRRFSIVLEPLLLWDQVRINKSRLTGLILDSGGDVTTILDGKSLTTLENPGGVECALPQALLVYVEEANSVNGTAKERLGKSPSVRNLPDVSGAKVYSLSPYQTIEFVQKVYGSKVSTDEWLELPDGNFVNYIVSGKQYFDILTNPGTDPPPPPAGKPATIDMVLTSGSIVTVRDENGNILWSGTA